jgi:hypothetical protein
MQPGQHSVVICGLAAARVGDPAFCSSPRDVITKGEPSVLIVGKMAARQGDATAHGGVITGGAHCVLIGHSEGVDCVRRAGQSRSVFVKGLPIAEKRKRVSTVIESSGNAVLDAARKHFEAYQRNGAVFVYAVARDMGVADSIGIEADSQIDFMKKNWQSVTRDEAVALSSSGKLVVAGLRSDAYAVPRKQGHVAIVTPGNLYRGVYPTVWSGSAGGIAGQSQGERSVGQIWRIDDRDRVNYFVAPSSPSA